MVTTEERIVLEVIAKATGFKQLSGQLDQVSKSFSKLTSSIGQQKRFLDLNKQAKTVLFYCI